MQKIHNHVSHELKMIQQLNSSRKIWEPIITLAMIIVFAMLCIYHLGNNITRIRITYNRTVTPNSNGATTDQFSESEINSNMSTIDKFLCYRNILYEFSVVFIIINLLAIPMIIDNFDLNVHLKTSAWIIYLLEAIYLLMHFFYTVEQLIRYNQGILCTQKEITETTIVDVETKTAEGAIISTKEKKTRNITVEVNGNEYFFMKQLTKIQKIAIIDKINTELALGLIILIAINFGVAKNNKSIYVLFILVIAFILMHIPELTIRIIKNRKLTNNNTVSVGDNTTSIGDNNNTLGKTELPNNNTVPVENNTNPEVINVFVRVYRYILDTFTRKYHYIVNTLTRMYYYIFIPIMFYVKDVIKDKGKKISITLNYLCVLIEIIFIIFALLRILVILLISLDTFLKEENSKPLIMLLMDRTRNILCKLFCFYGNSPEESNVFMALFLLLVISNCIYVFRTGSSILITLMIIIIFFIADGVYIELKNTKDRVICKYNFCYGYNYILVAVLLSSLYKISKSQAPIISLKTRHIVYLILLSCIIIYNDNDTCYKNDDGITKYIINNFKITLILSIALLVVQIVAKIKNIKPSQKFRKIETNN